MNPLLLPSKHRRSRSTLPDTIVIHAMGEFVNEMFATDFLSSAGLSAHYLILPDGRLINTVLPSQVAYHAKEWNNRSIGIELLLEGVHTYQSFLQRMKEPNPYSSAQLETIFNLLDLLEEEYPISQVLRHSDIDSEKFDPGPNFPFMEVMGGR